MSEDLKRRLVDHILKLKQKDVEFARHALKHYDELLPHFELKNAIREKLNEPDRETSLAGQPPVTQPQER